MADEEEKYKRFEDLVQRHRHLVYQLCWLRSSGDEALCGELVQDCYIALWRRLDSLRPGAHVLQQRTWVLWQCRSAFSHRRHRRHTWRPLDEDLAAILAAPDDSPQRELIEELAAPLDDRERRLLDLLLAGYSQREIALLLGVQTDSVKKMRRRIIDKMRQNYRRNNNE